MSLLSNVARNVSLVIAVSLPWVAACGGSGASPSSKDSGKGADGGVRNATGSGSGADGGQRGDSGIIGPSGPGAEGAACNATIKCTGKLSCVASIFADSQGKAVGVCGRGCTTATDCKTDEVCFSYSGASKDGHCVNVVKDEYGICGVADTSVCDQTRTCLYLNEPIGVCVDTCALDGAGAGDDAGTGALPDGAVMCAGKETCVDGVISTPQKNEGVCGIVAKRGETCGIEHGIYCPTTDICAPKDPKNPSSGLVCFQDCSAANAKCDKGKCVTVQNGSDSFAYCM